MILILKSTQGYLLSSSLGERKLFVKPNSSKAGKVTLFKIINFQKNFVFLSKFLVRKYLGITFHLK